MPRTVPTHRIDTPALWRALDTRRRARDISWRAVARECGLSISSFSRLQDGDSSLHGNVLASLLVWLGRAEPLNDLIAVTGDGPKQAPLPARSEAAEALAHQLRHATVAELEEALRLVGVTITLAVTEENDPT